MDVSFRFAEADDASLVLRFIREFAAFQRNADTVTATEDSLRKWLFEEGKAEVVFAQMDGVPVGFAMLNHSFSAHKGLPAIFLECIFIREEYRGQGIGRALMQEIAKVCIERGWVRVECNAPDWNAASGMFYNSLGAEEMNGWTLYRITDETLVDLAEGRRPVLDEDDEDE